MGETGAYGQRVRLAADTESHSHRRPTAARSRYPNDRAETACLLLLYPMRRGQGAAPRENSCPRFRLTNEKEAKISILQTIPLLSECKQRGASVLRSDHLVVGARRTVLGGFFIGAREKSGPLSLPRPLRVGQRKVEND